MTEPAPTAPLTVARLRSLGWLEAVDEYFARFVCSLARRMRAAAPETPAQSSEAERLLALGVAVASRFLREGHVCAPLRELAQQPVLAEDGTSWGTLPSFAAWRQALIESPAVAVAGSEVLDQEAIPLVLDAGDRLYLHRYFAHEQRLAKKLVELEGGEPSSTDEPSLDHYFPPPGAHEEEDRQRTAARAALSSRLTIVSGGPGTGKTSTVVKILALLVERAQARGEAPPLVRLLAPTGKAAARLCESIQQAKTRLAMPSAVAEAITDEASTIHRALGSRHDSSTRFLHGPQRPLAADVVVLDEASMVDLALMRHLVEALEPETRLLLLGDRHQLASVEAGSVLSELCEVSAGSSQLVELHKSYRFNETSGIFALARAVKSGDAQDALAVLRSERGDLTWHSTGRPLEDPTFRRQVVEHYGAALRQASAADILREFGRFRVLAAHRRGPAGVEALNLTIRRWLAQAALVPTTGESFRGRLIMVTKNDYGVGLHNGDIGLMWTDDAGRLAVFFAEGERIRQLSPAHLPEHESAYALTVHKSQGSEYESVALVCPHAGSPLATRELLYTGITRARRSVAVFGTEDAVRYATSRDVQRYSGLADAVSRARQSA